MHGFVEPPHVIVGSILVVVAVVDSGTEVVSLGGMLRVKKIVVPDVAVAHDDVAAVAVVVVWPLAKIGSYQSTELGADQNVEFATVLDVEVQQKLGVFGLIESLPVPLASLAPTRWCTGW